GILAFDLLDDALALGFEVESESFVEFLSELLGVHLVVLVVATLFARLAVLVAGLWLAHRLARLRCIAVALSYSTSIALVVFESRWVDDLYRYPHRIRAAPAEIPVLNELGEVLAAFFADLAVAFEVLPQSHR